MCRETGVEKDMMKAEKANVGLCGSPGEDIIGKWSEEKGTVMQF